MITLLLLTPSDLHPAYDAVTCAADARPSHFRDEVVFALRQAAMVIYVDATGASQRIDNPRQPNLVTLLESLAATADGGDESLRALAAQARTLLATLHTRACVHGEVLDA